MTKRASGPVREIQLCDECELRGSCRFGIDDMRRLPDGTTRGEFHVPADAAGHVVAHGGWTAWVFDEFLGYTAIALSKWAVTAELTVRYHRPVSLTDRIAVTASGVLDGERRRLMRGEMRQADSGVLLASAEGVWIELRDAGAHYDRAVQ